MNLLSVSIDLNFLLTVIITLIYAIATIFLYRETRISRKELNKPLIYAKPYFITPQAMFIQIANIGKGSALDVDIEVKTNPPSSIKRWGTSFLPPNSETIEIRLDEIYLKKIFANYKQIIIKTKYKDIYGKSYNPKIILDVHKLQNQANSGGVIWKEDFHQQMDGIKKGLEEISRNTRGLARVRDELGKLDDINKSLKRLNDINISLKKLNDINVNLDNIDKRIETIEMAVKGLGPIFKKQKK